MKNDLELRRDILDELEWEPSIDAAGIGVAVQHGIVTLTGTARSYSEKLLAERAVRRVKGVKGIANDVDVHLPGGADRSDSEIVQAAIQALRWKSLLPAGRVTVSVSNGWITLEGEVDWQYQKNAAFEAVHHLYGVTGVTNLIAITPRVSTVGVKSRIEDAFRRSADLDAQRISVEAHDGKVTLRGDVPSWSERQEAERTAWAATGVNQVENLIAISP